MWRGEEGRGEEGLSGEVEEAEGRGEGTSKTDERLTMIQVLYRL